MPVTPFRRGFERSWPIGAVGANCDNREEPDLSGRMAIEALQSAGVEPLLWLDPERETGKVAVVYCSEHEQFLVADGGANDGFGPNSLTAVNTKVLDTIWRLVSNVTPCSCRGFLLAGLSAYTCRVNGRLIETGEST